MHMHTPGRWSLPHGHHTRHTQEELHVSIARAMVQSPSREQLMAAVKHLHPVSLTDLPPEAVGQARCHYAPAIGKLLAGQQQQVRWTCQNMRREHEEPV